MKLCTEDLDAVSGMCRHLLEMETRNAQDRLSALWGDYSFNALGDHDCYSSL